MRERNKINMYFIISEFCLIIFPSTFLFMPITNSDTFCYARYVTVAIGIVFWNNDISLFNKKENKEDPEKMLYIFKQYSIGGRHSIRPRYSGDDNIMLT